jgi:hypothetical protein
VTLDRPDAVLFPVVSSPAELSGTIVSASVRLDYRLPTGVPPNGQGSLEDPDSLETQQDRPGHAPWQIDRAVLVE